MVPEFAPIAYLFAHGDRALDRLVGHLAPADWRRGDGAGHTPRWIMGHLATVRTRILDLMGIPPLEAPWTGAFGRGASDADVPEDLDMAMVVEAFHEAQRRMDARWEELPAEHFARPLGRTLPDGSDTVGGAIRFLAWHEAYHLGQLGLLGRPSPVTGA